MLSLGIRANTNLQDTIKECAGIFSKAQKSISIVGGSLKSPFYRDNRIIESLKKAVGNGVTVRIAMENLNLSEDGAKGIRNIDNIEVWQLTNPVERHQMSIDGSIARIEKKHDAEAVMHPAIICHRVPLMAQKIDKYFNELEKTPIK